MFDIALDPFVHLDRCLRAAEQRGEPEHNAMTLTTVGPHQRPSARVVFYKGLIRGGLSFYTNYDSEKSRDLAGNPWACVNFYYAKSWEQIRVTGKTYRLTRDENEAYFRSRPRLSQIGAWASLQSAPLANFDHFNQRVQEFTKSFEGQEVACPPNWGGFHLIPEEFEFWFGREGRLHERYVYLRDGSGLWKSSLKYP